MCPLPNTLSCMDDIQCWALTLLLCGKAVGHLLSILSSFFRGILLLPSSSSAQSSVVCSPHFYFLSLFHFRWWLLAPSPFGGSSSPYFPHSLIPEFLNSKLHSCSLLKLPTFAPSFLLAILSSALSFLRRKQLYVSRKKAGGSYLVFLDNRNSAFQNSPPSADLEANGYTWKREMGQNLGTAGEPSQHWSSFRQAVSKLSGRLKRTGVFGSMKRESFWYSTRKQS